MERALSKLRALWGRERDAVQTRFEAERARTTLAEIEAAYLVKAKEQGLVK